MYKLDLLTKMKIYLIQYIIMLKPAHGNVEPLIYKMEMYKNQEKNKQDVQKIINYKKINEQL